MSSADTKQQVENEHGAATLEELRVTALGGRGPLSLPQVKKLRERAFELCEAPVPVRLGVVHTYTSDLLDPWLESMAALHGIRLQTWHAPYGTTQQEALENSSLNAFSPDVTLFLMRYEDFHPRLMEPLHSLDEAAFEQVRDETADAVCQLLMNFRLHNKGLLLLSCLPPMQGTDLGAYDAQARNSETARRNALKAQIGNSVRDYLDDALLLDLDTLFAEFGRHSLLDLRYWYSYQYPYSALGSLEVSRAIARILATRVQTRAKVIVLDADNTLWGGIIGEDGMGGIDLGPDYPGNAFLDFQRQLLAYKNRGFLLALCSKNNEADVMQVLREHPHHLLREDQFAAIRANWIDKTSNIESIARELNLGINSMIFVDDSSHECAGVRHHLPEVEVVQTPANPLEIPRCLDRVARLEVLSITDEDLSKTGMYIQERKRKKLQENIQSSGADIDDYLRSLEMAMEVRFDDASQVKRLSQLSQKTNQFNLTTQRYSESDIRGFIDSDSTLVSQFSLADIFGDSGTVGLAIWKIDGDQVAELDTFLMSCRVIGRKADEAFFRAQLEKLLALGATAIRCRYIPTQKNQLVADFLPRMGLAEAGEGCYSLSLGDTPPGYREAIPIAVTEFPASH